MINHPIRFSFVLLLVSLTHSASHAYAQSSICYAKPDGNDLNDGSYWAFAKADVMACYDALPPAGGTIYIMGSGMKGDRIPACKSSDPNGCGIWIMGRWDPNYSHPPAGWRKAKTAVSFVGVGGQSFNTFGRQGTVIVNGGSAVDNNHPGIWLSSFGNIMRFENIQLPGTIGRGIVVGENSKHVRTAASNAGVVNANFVNVIAGGGASAPGLGPTVDITGQSYQDKFYHCMFAVNTAAVSPTDNTGAAVLLDGQTGGGGSAEFYDLFTDGGGKGGGSIKYFPIAAGNPGSLIVHGLLTEVLQGVPAVWITGSHNSNQLIDISDIQEADSVGNTPAVQNDGGVPASQVLVYGTTFGAVVGPATIIGSGPYTQGTSNPLTQGQQGIIAGTVFGQVDVNRRAFSPVATQFVNLASQVCANWTGTEATITCSQAAPDGTSNAGNSVATGSTSGTYFYNHPSYTPVVGHWLIGGVWVRDVANGWFYGYQPAAIQINGTFVNNGSGGRAILGAQPWDDGDWHWVSVAAKVATVTSNSLSFLGLGGQNTGYTSTNYFAPILLDVSGVSDNEANWIAANLSSYRDDATPGQVSLLRGEQFKADSIQIGACATVSSGKGAPTAKSCNGSIYLRQDGAAGSTFYIYENGGWKAQF